MAHAVKSLVYAQSGGGVAGDDWRLHVGGILIKLMARAARARRSERVFGRRALRAPAAALLISYLAERYADKARVERAKLATPRPVAPVAPGRDSPGLLKPLGLPKTQS